MSDNLKCDHCGRPIEPEAGEPVCPHCLLALGLEAGEETAAAPTPAGGRKKEDGGQGSGAGEPSSLAGPAAGPVGNRRIGDYELLEVIGRGGMGVVYKARQKSLNRLVALKMIVHAESASPRAMARFRVEAEAAAKLEHPHIVPTYELGEFHGQPFFTMRLIEGSNLAKEMRRVSLATCRRDQKGTGKTHLREAQERIAHLMATIARAVHHAHQNGIVHRDLKPSNILLDQQGQPYLTDFGIAKIVADERDLTDHTSVVGSLNYMAPEQATGQRTTGASDVYGLGAILYELLTGRPPFHADTPLETLKRVTEEEPTHPTLLNRQANSELATICLKCLEKDPRCRYSSAEAMAEDLECWLRHEPIKARRASLLLRVRRWTSRNPSVASLLCVLSLALAGALMLGMEKARVIAIMRTEVKRELDDLWKAKVDSVTITAGKRVLLMGGKTTESPNLLTFGIYVHDETPIERLNAFAPILNDLEESLSGRLGRPVQIDFTIFRSYEVAMGAVLVGKVDFARFGAAPYVIAKSRDPNVLLLAAQKHEKFNGVIFTQTTNLALRTLEGLRGKTIVFGNTNSTTGCQLGRLFLTDQALHAKDFANWGTNYLKNHAEVTNAIAHGDYDAGAAKGSFVRGNPNFHILGIYPNIGMVWVTRPGLEPNTEQAVRASLLRMKPKLLKGLEDRVIGFEAKEDSGYNDLRQKMKKAEHFYDP